jgi:tRNA(His) 5'-end guanylyltransferase
MKLDDRMKMYEAIANSERAMPLLPLMARLDGKSFHTFTKDMERPYDKNFSDLMVDTTKHLVSMTSALMGYTQSDEITLLFYADNTESQLFFNGRLFKLNSILAAAASVYFNSKLKDYLPNKAHLMPLFDCRTWNVPTQEEAVNVFVWRELDATKNSITMAAQSVYSHNALMGKNGSDKQEMLFQKGINWNNYPSFFKRGTYIQNKRVDRPFTVDEIEKLPPNHEARKCLEEGRDFSFSRKEIAKLDLPPILKISNKIEVFFRGEEPLLYEEAQTE